MELSITGKKAKWYTRDDLNQLGVEVDLINQLGVEVASNEYYTEYAVHFMVRHKNPAKSKLPEEVIQEGDNAIKKREEELRELRETKLFNGL